jgi:hypothetical protein
MKVLSGGRTRARTWDPMIKSHLLSHYLKRLHSVAEIDHHKSAHEVRIVVRDFLLYGKRQKSLILLVAREGLGTTSQNNPTKTINCHRGRPHVSCVRDTGASPFWQPHEFEIYDSTG